MHAERDAQAGPIRLRPILMTSMATMMAALPPALGARIRGLRDRPLGVPMDRIAIIGGTLDRLDLTLPRPSSSTAPAFYVVSLIALTSASA
jgi:multidrug efflux pump